MSAAFTIRRATPEDAPAIAAVLLQTGYFSRLAAQTLEQTQAQVQRQMELGGSQEGGASSIYIALAPGGEVCGYCAVHWIYFLFLPGPEGYVSELFVSPEARGQGAGGLLLAAAVAEGRQRGAYRMGLINMRQRESYQRKFYEKQGWEERPEAANFVLIL